jgi:hypothetical protein
VVSGAAQNREEVERYACCTLLAAQIKYLDLSEKTVLRICINLFRIWIQHFKLNTDTDLDPVPIQVFDDKKIGKNLQLKIFFDIFKIKNCNLLIPRPL